MNQREKGYKCPAAITLIIQILEKVISQLLVHLLSFTFHLSNNPGTHMTMNIHLFNFMQNCVHFKNSKGRIFFFANWHLQYYMNFKKKGILATPYYNFF